MLMSFEFLATILPFLLFPCFWYSATLLVAKMSGWQQLAEVYAIEQYPARQRQKAGLKTIFMNKCRYKNSVVISYDEDGLFLQTMIFFRAGHALLYIPWSDTTVLSEPNRPFWRYAARKLTFAAMPDVKVTVSKRLIERIEAFRHVQMMEDEER